MPDGYDSDRHDYDPNQRGRIFENGIERYFRDRQRGYVQQSRIYETTQGRIRFDHAKEDRGRTFTIEDKSGRIEGRKDEKQLKAVRELIEKGLIQGHVLRSVEGETVSKEAQRLIDGLKRDFPDKFTHQVITRDEARQVWALGLEMERGQQLELPGVGELARQAAEKQLAQQKQKDLTLAQSLEKAKQQAKGKEALAKTVAEKNQQLAQAKENFLFIDPADVQRAHESTSNQLNKVREEEKAQTKSMLWSIGVTGEQAKIMEQILAQNRENQRQEVTKGIESIGQVAQREAQVQAAREAAEKYQQQQMQLAQQRGYAPELQAIMQIMNQGRPAPNVSMPSAPTQTPSVERGGRAAERALELARQQEINRGLDPRQR
ncbi:hypothetical protein [Nocardia transvalensis]|uniref:hypothetical protein n=1 Tax=Nocardia transvalensis TaxID=37333 RepID=UPI001895CEDA|nr:hypothetical protein [Nocardia transvalensis]MBF6330875.1 hypothetical protein [Nocardia transvalensis]